MAEPLRIGQAYQCNRVSADSRRQKEEKCDDEPEHELIITTIGDMVYISGGEQIVRHVRSDISIAIAPFRIGRDALDLADQHLGELDSGIRVAFDLVFAAGPCPGSVPRGSRVRYAVYISALRAHTRVHPPKIVVDGVGAARMGAILFAKFLAVAATMIATVFMMIWDAYDLSNEVPVSF